MPLTYETLETARLYLLRPEREHTPSIFASFSADPEVTRYLTWRPARTIAEAEAAMSRRLDSLRAGSELSWIVVLKSDGSIVGSFSVWPSGSEAEIGFAFARAVWGRGLATEACKVVLSWLAKSGDVTRAWAACDVENHRSRRVLEKAGLIHERVDPAHVVHPNLGAELRACHILGLELSAA